MAKQEKKEFSLTASGYEYDKELTRVSVKVFPALQALIANQHDLIEVAKKYTPEKFIFIEGHLAELTEVEETIAKTHARHCVKREESKRKRQDKDKNLDPPVQDTGPAGPLLEEFNEPLVDAESHLDQLAAGISPGLPSARLPERKAPARQEEMDVRRIAIGASIKALSNLLGRDLKDQEIAVIERQVDAYL